MRDDDHLGGRRGRCVDVGQDRRDLVVNGQRREVGRRAVAAGKVNGEHGPFEARHMPVPEPCG